MLGLGRLGGHSLTHASDLDVIYLHTRRAGRRFGRAEAARSQRLFQPPREPSHGRAQRADRLGPALRRRRPASSRRARRGCSSSRSRRSSNISESEAWTWEHMALCRARPVFGSAEVRDARRRADRRASFECRATGRKVIADAAKMRADMERHKPPRSALDVKLGPGGLVDLEFATHVLQLTTAVGLDHAARGGARSACRRIFSSSKYCRFAKVAFANAGDDAPRRAGGRQAHRRRPGSSSPTRAGRRAGTSFLPSMTPRGRASRELWTSIKGEA